MARANVQVMLCDLPYNKCIGAAISLKMPSETAIWTIGHSTRSIEAFIDALRAHGIQALVDVRRFPKSRRLPHFEGDALKLALSKIGIDYHHFAEMGGWRKPRPDSVNTAWRSPGFRGYADHMESVEFQQAIERLLDIARHRRTAVMCAERLWFRCHRMLIADYLKATGIEVIHIEDAETAVAHPYTSAACIVDGRLSYRNPLSQPQTS